MQTKVLHYFNPGHENALLNRHPSYTPPATITEIMRELSSIPAWYADAEDRVLVVDDFDESYHKQFIKKGFKIPNTIKYKNLQELYKPKVCLWGIAPRDIRYFEDINNKLRIEAILPQWHEKIIHHSSRFYAADVLKELQDTSAHFGTISPPLFFTDLESIEQHSQNSLTKLLVKSPYSSSGRGLLWIPPTGVTRAERQILQGMLNRQHTVSLEPVYEKVVDFAMEFMSDGKGNVTFEGFSLFSTTNKGSYTGNILTAQSDMSDILAHHVGENLLSATKVKLTEILSRDCALEYQGCIGVDMMIYLDKNVPRLHPCVEINFRYNMGYLSLKLYEKHIMPGSKGLFQIDYDKSGTMLAKHHEMQHKYPLEADKGRIISGYLSLCPITQQSRYRAYMLVEKL